MERLTPFADAAAALAAAGWLVFPVKPRGKTPLIPNEMGGRGHKDGTTDPAQVARWARAYPTANIGTRVPQSLIVVDVDPRNGGDVTAAGWEAEHGPIPETLTVWSGRGDGGRHLYFLAPAFKPSRDRLKGTGVDLKDHGGYVVLPPSIHPEGDRGPYRWGEPLAAPVALPEWLADLLRPIQQPTATRRPVRLRIAGSGLPSEDFNESHTWADVLEPYGWQESAGKPGRWLRPGRDLGSSAHVVTTKTGDEVLHVFSSAAAPLEDQKNYSKFAAWAELAHRGDWKAAVAAAKQGGR